MQLIIIQPGELDSWAEAARGQGVAAHTIFANAIAQEPVVGGWAEGAVVLIEDGVKVTAAMLESLRAVASAVILRVVAQRPTQGVLRAVSGVTTPHPWLARKLAAEGLAVLSLPVGFDPRLIGADIDAVAPPEQPPWVERSLGVSALTPWQKDDAHALVSCAQEIPLFRYLCPCNKDTPALLQNTAGAVPVSWVYYARALAESRFVVDYHTSPSVIPKDDGSGRKWYTTNQLTVDAAGMGAVLVTEQRVNLVRYLKPWAECVPYINPREAAIHTQRELENPEHAANIARAGQARVWAEHLITHRIPRLLEFAERVQR